MPAQPNPRPCRALECDRLAETRQDLCLLHYKRWKRQQDGRPKIARFFGEATLSERLWRQVKREEGGCWGWTGHTASGYGRLWVDGHDQATHRLMYELIVEPIPDSLVLDHLCYNRRCCNPMHLEVVTLAENSRRGKNRYWDSLRYLAALPTEDSTVQAN